jgi:15-cis-phytoene synthase
MLRRHDPTYYLAVLRLPAEVRPAVYALYGFVRGADEIVDGAGRGADPASRLAALDAWEDELARGLAAGASGHRVVGAIVDAGQRFELPLEELRTYMDSMRADCGLVRIETRSELERYMDGSAAAVGRIMAVILGARREGDAFARLGVAFQLTNFVRDVRVDYGLDRIYLPAEEFVRFGVVSADLGLVSASPALRALLAAEVRRARGYFAESEPAYAAALPAARAGMRFARAAYLAVLDRIEAVDYDVLRHMIRPGSHGLAKAALAALKQSG